MEADQEQQQAEASYDAKFEFDAPRYYDFDNMSGGTPCDRWFDTAPDGPGCKPEKGAGVVAREPFKAIQQEQQPAAKPREPAAPEVKLAADAQNKPTLQQTEHKKANIVTSWGGSAGAGAAAAAAAAGAAAGKADSDASRGVKAAGATKSAGMRKSTGHALQARVPRRVSTQDGPRSEPPVTRSRSRLGLQLCSPVAEGKPHKASPPATRARPFTAVPTGRTSARTQHAALQLHKVLQPKVTKPVRSTKPLTLPDDFELETSKRMAAAAQDGPSPFKSLAEKVREFQCKTPVRFKTKPGKAAPTKQRSPITKAESPHLMTSRRSRPSRYKTQQELEDEDLERARQQQFHAKPVDARVLSSSGQLGVPKVDKPRLTEPQPFHLRSDSRAKVRKSHELPSMEQAAAAAAFRAQPLKKSILDGPTFKPRIEKHEGTVPKSPLLRTKLRSHVVKPEEPKTQRKPRPLSASSAGAGGAKATQPQPFHLQTEARGAQHKGELAARLAAEQEKARRLRRVTARPLPVTVDVPVVPPKPQSKALTLPEPFTLMSMSRHEDFEAQHRQHLQEEQEAARRAAKFKARPLPASGPFVVHESDAPLTVPVDPHLRTDTRAVEREEFDAQVAAKVAQEEEEKRRQEQLKRQHEEQAVKEYRKKLRFSARPMPNFNEPYFALPSDKPLTNPQTPNFASKKLKKTGG